MLAPELPSPARADAGQSRPALSPAAALVFSLLIPVTPSLVAQRIPCRRAKPEHSQHCPGMSLSRIQAPAQRGCSGANFTTSGLSPVEGVGNEEELDAEVVEHPWLGFSVLVSTVGRGGMRAAAAGRGGADRGAAPLSALGSKKGSPLAQRQARRVHIAFLAATPRSFCTSRAAECSRSWIWWVCGHLHTQHHLSSRQPVRSSGGWGSALPVLPLHPLPTLGAVQPLGLRAAASSAKRLSVVTGVLGRCGAADPQTRSTSEGSLRVCCLKSL